MRALLLCVVVCAFGWMVAGAGAAQVDSPCLQPSGDNGATACTIVLQETVSGDLGSDVVTECLGEDVFLTLDATAVAHQVFRPDGTSQLASSHASVHGSGYGVVTGTKIEFTEPGSAFLDTLPDGGEVFHTVSSAEVNTQGGAANLELTIEAQEVIAPDGTVTSSVLNVQETCGSDHASEHLH
jgi:hypothetical protein